MNVLDLIQNVARMPFIYGGKRYEGTVLTQPKLCRDKCTNSDCAALPEKIDGHFTCSRGLSCHAFRIAGERVVFFGIIVSELNTVIVGSRRKPYKANVISATEVAEAIDQLDKALSVYSAAASDGERDAVAYFHDIRTSVGIVLSWCQRMIAASPGTTFEEKLNAADRNTHNLFRSINLLQEQLELADIIANPAAITYGQRRPSSLTGFWYRMVKLFEPRASSRGIDIRFQAHGDEITISAFNSFQFLPLILLDNAIKYSYKNRVIYVELSDQGNVISLSVSSFGKTVPREYRTSIFGKHERGPNGIEQNPEGMGMGLFIADQIVKAHGFTIRYEAPDPEVAVGNNKFIVEIPRTDVQPVPPQS